MHRASPFLDTLLEDWQGVSPLIAAALDDPRFGQIVLNDRLTVVHVTGKLATLLGLPSELPGQDGDLAYLLSNATALEENCSQRVQEYCARRIANGAEHETPLLLSGRESTCAFQIDVRRIGHRHWIASFEDTGLRSETEARVTALALRDPLTGLANRQLFEQSVTSALAQSRDGQLALFLIDLDRFKAVNDTLGHATGDETLRLVAQRLQSVVRERDVIARLGGDEFAILLSAGMLPGDLATLADRIINLLERTYLVGGQVVNVGASIGIAVGPQDGSRHDQLLKSADLALYHSKTSGRGMHHFFNPSMEARAQARRNLELDLRKAMALRQLELHYRPQVDISTRSLVGFEAALQWRHPERGLVPPEDFTPLAEHLGLTVAMGDWTFRAACREAGRWPDGVVITVKASRLQFENNKLADTVRRALEAAQISGSKLEIEINENVLLKDEKSVLATLHDLRALGVKIAMGNFGVGYASLKQLASFPFDKVKIDRSLVEDGTGNAKQRAIIGAIASLGASLGMSTMAQGVETPEQLADLRSGGNAAMQGYLGSTAVPANELSQHLAGLLFSAEETPSFAQRTIQ